MKLLKNVPDNSILEIDATSSSFIDSDVIQAIRNFGMAASQRNIQLVFLENRDEDFQIRYSRSEVELEVFD